ncbi:hypothetical protein AMTRI_Chr02g265140 [Amborella trichopoda]|uniref:Uncharacterized protein n=1 Tax=Amborella trichopoda TaxID=13333 RepID=W1P5M7_AMBTC|nr:probable glycosyltransferase 2 [Amborella trichopoda]ERN02260.1 hypothetical protein AMTR_s00045p00232030 [Amborella trichopoda]|eukprot:XP_006840585.3 probable glycosyltransferase 2 [Amborella trichopoda]
MEPLFVRPLLYLKGLAMAFIGSIISLLIFYHLLTSPNALENKALVFHSALSIGSHEASSEHIEIPPRTPIASAPSLGPHRIAPTILKPKAVPGEHAERQGSPKTTSQSSHKVGTPSSPRVGTLGSQGVPSNEGSSIIEKQSAHRVKTLGEQGASSEDTGTQGDYGASSKISGTLGRLRGPKIGAPGSHTGLNPPFILVSGERSGPCETVNGSVVMAKSYKNKVDYCNWHGCTVWYTLEVWEEGYTGTWARYPLLLRLMKANPSVAWFMWMDSDAIFTDFSFEIPIHAYDSWGKKMVVPGFWDKVYRDDPDWVGLNAGVFLMKNCNWSHEFLKKWMKFGHPKNKASSKISINSMVKSRPQDWDPDDQSALVFLLNSNRTDSQANVFLEASYDLHGFWELVIDQLVEGKNGNRRPPFVTHFCGCKFCGGRGSEVPLVCLDGFTRAFGFADNQFLARVALRHPNITSPDPLLSPI